MVEFGLKLEDNKVAEWSEHYINYEKLKEILKKAKNAQKKRDDHAKKRPKDAAEIIKAHKSGESKYVTLPSSSSFLNLNLLTPSSSRLNLNLLDASANVSPPPTTTPGAPSSEQPTQNQQQQQDETQQEQPTESTSLLPQKSTDAESVASDRDGRDSALSLSGISDYFGSRYERTLRDYLKEIDLREKQFDEVFTTEVEKVSKFYFEKLEELETRLQLLVENVAASYSNVHTQIDNYMMDSSQNLVDLGSGTPVTATLRKREPAPPLPPLGRQNLHRRKQSLPDVVKRVQMYTKHQGQRWLGSLKGADDDEDDEEKNGDPAVKTSLLRADKEGETDSIKRALIDQYRTAKLLHNFALMNYTACVKIVKKHDKTIPEAKGKYKHTTEPKNLCNEGKAVDELANRLEKFFAIWFCDGDVRAAHAQMLPKRGDGLEMDWTQLRYVHKVRR